MSVGQVSTSTPSTIAVLLWPARADGRVLRAVVLCVLGSLLMVAAAKTKVPFWPVPMTMQTFAVLVIAMAYGPRLAMASIALYLAQGALGLPVFTDTPEKGIGLAYMAGPTGGYLVGFLLSAGFVGWLAERGWCRHPVRAVGALALGLLPIYIPGILWLGALFGWAPIAYDLYGIGAIEAATPFVYGLLPFLPGEALKVALGAGILSVTWNLLSAGR